ncbi:MAG TPA: histidine kinase [Candidatus Sulfotelmatobacter sp.]|nr:histidine kinase [Candidatus Sulfotelmatobacter sp.]
MNSMKHKWTFYLLWPNLAVAVVFLILLASNQLPSAREFFHALVYSLVYANLIAVFGVLLVELLAQRWARRKLSLLPVFALCVFVIIPVGFLAVQTLLMGIGFLAPQNFWPQYFHNLRVSTPLAMVFGLGALVHASLRERVQVAEAKVHEKEVAEERALKLATEARLRSLESRVHPHFLFNTLNSISSLIATNPDRAERMVGQLAVLLRASLDTGNQQLIPLRQELGMVESYVDIERVRFGDKLRGSIDIPADLRDAKVPPMSVQALVENAVKHGITPQNGGGEVWVTASDNHGSVRIEVRDSGPGFDLAVVPAGHGLDNLVERLNALFGERARIHAFRRDGRSIVEMVLPRV